MEKYFWCGRLKARMPIIFTRWKCWKRHHSKYATAKERDLRETSLPTLDNMVTKLNYNSRLQFVALYSRSIPYKNYKFFTENIPWKLFNMTGIIVFEHMLNLVSIVKAPLYCRAVLRNADRWEALSRSWICPWWRPLYSPKSRIHVHRARRTGRVRNGSPFLLIGFDLQFDKTIECLAEFKILGWHNLNWLNTIQIQVSQLKL